MNHRLAELMAFLDEQRTRQASHFPNVKFEKVLSFMGTTSVAGSHAAVGVRRVVQLEPSGEQELLVHLAGPLPRAPAPGECVAVHIDKVEQYRGFQVKTRPLPDDAAAAADLVDEPGGVRIRGSHIYTVHHSPYTMKFFERIPQEDVLDTVGDVPCALVAVGRTANLSPRFVFHHEERMGRPVLFHGDGLALKTYMNLRLNRQETRLVLDLDSWSGWALQGTVEEWQPDQRPEVYQRICDGFAAGNWGKPSRVFRLVADSWAPIGPVEPVPLSSR